MVRSLRSREDVDIEATAEVARLGQALDRADGFIVLTAEDNHGYPAVLNNAMDWTAAQAGRLRGPHGGCPASRSRISREDPASGEDLVPQGPRSG